MARKIRVGVIGCGGISRVHLEGYRKCPNVELAAVCDIDARRAREKAETFEVPRWFTSTGKLLALELDAVSVCTPNFNHKPTTIRALRAGKHVLCEKPIAMNARQAQQMIDEADKAGRKLQIGLHQRFRPESRFLKKLIDSGTIGRPYYARSLSIRRRGVPSWGVFGQKKLQGGGPLIDIGVHAIDLTWYLMGKPTPVSVSGQTYETIGARPGHVGRFGRWDHKTYDVEDLAVALVRFEGGETMMIESAFCANLDKDAFDAQIVGDKGGAQLSPLRVQVEMAGHLTDCTPNDVVTKRSPSPHHEEVAAFVDAVARDRPVPVPGTDAIWTTKIIDAIYASARAGREVRLK